ncbi:unnamed protein product [Aphis gossypii]|uniref:Uncharacterized protein n=1 Tax=Aphis gossypii TaxID=80765 RepID=A0A9P0J1Y3_APHGO|nr:unnamed protein product [Aphis gossypii]
MFSFEFEQTKCIIFPIVLSLISLTVYNTHGDIVLMMSTWFSITVIINQMMTIITHHRVTYVAVVSAQTINPNVRNVGKEGICGKIGTKIVV